MKIKSIKENFFLNLVRLFLGSFFTIITMPYITRVLGSENIGKIEYSLTIVGYFILFTNLGISQYGVREISKERDNQELTTKLFIELFIIMIITTCLGMIVFCLYIKYILLDNLILYYIFIINMIFINFGFEWFYQGVENQKYITYRYILVRIIALISIFIFIKNEKDYWKYAIILMVMTSGSNIFNFFKIKEYLVMKKIRLSDLEIKKHIKPMFVILLGILAVNIYYQLDITLIKYYSDNKGVSYYVVANKLVRLCIIIVTALNMIMLPRLSNYLKLSKIEEYRKYLKYSLDYISFFVFPITFGLLLLSNEIIQLFSGPEFKSSELLLKILSLTIVFISYHQCIGIQVLSTRNKENVYTKVLLIGVILNTILNIVLGMKYKEIGITIATAISEGIVCILLLIYIRIKKICIFNKNIYKNIFKCLLASGIATLFLKKIEFIYKEQGLLLRIGIVFLIYLLLYLLLLFVFKYEYYALLNQIRRKK